MYLESSYKKSRENDSLTWVISKNIYEINFPLELEKGKKRNSKK